MLWPATRVIQTVHSPRLHDSSKEPIKEARIRGVRIYTSCHSIQLLDEHLIVFPEGSFQNHTQSGRSVLQLTLRAAAAATRHTDRLSPISTKPVFHRSQLSPTMLSAIHNGLSFIIWIELKPYRNEGPKIKNSDCSSVSPIAFVCMAMRAQKHHLGPSINPYIEDDSTRLS